MRSRNSPNSRRTVLVLLGYNEHDFLRNILTYARQACWTLDTNYNRIGLPPDPGYAFDGMIGVVGKQQEIDIVRAHASVPHVDLSGAWLWDLKDPAVRRVARVTYDPAALGQMATDHLVSRGFRNLAFVNTSNGWHERPCLAACAAVADKAHAQFIEIPFYRQLHVVTSYSAVFKVNRAMCWLGNALCDLPKPCGVIVVDDWALNLLQVCEQRSLRVPDEAAVIGLYNHRDMCEYTAIPVSAVDADCEHIAYEGAGLLDRLISGAKVPEKTYPRQAQGCGVRQSTDVLAVDHSEISAALRFIWDHFPEPIHVKDVVAHTRMSHRGLALAFQKQIGHGIAQEIAQADRAGATIVARDESEGLANC